MADQSQVHVLMFPWLAHGHITPFVDFAKSLHNYGLKVSFLSTPLNIERIKHQLSQLQPTPEIELLHLPMPAIFGLPKGVESTSDLSKIGALNLIPLLIQALDLCEKPFEELLKSLSPDFVIHDMVQYWAPRVAAKLGIPTVNFMVLSGTSISFIAGHHRHRSKETLTAENLMSPLLGFPSTVVRRRLFETRRSLPSYQKKHDDNGNAEDVAFIDRLGIVAEESWATACNTCIELEGKFVKYFESCTARPVFPIGILMQNLPPQPVADPCLAWLDKHPARSVVFASFGSECALTRQQIAALILGLEESEIPFLCILISHVVPEFPGGTYRRGLVVTEWAPQLHILRHPSTGASLTHCGWTSITEGLRFGVPFIALPIQYDQGLNARLISQELKMGVEVRRNEEDGLFTKEDIASAVRVLMVEEEGSKIRSNVEEISSFLNKNDCQVHRRNIHNFVTALKAKASEKRNM